MTVFLFVWLVLKWIFIVWGVVALLGVIYFAYELNLMRKEEEKEETADWLMWEGNIERRIETLSRRIGNRDIGAHLDQLEKRICELEGDITSVGDRLYKMEGKV